MGNLFYEAYGLELGLEEESIMDFDELDEYEADLSQNESDDL